MGSWTQLGTTVAAAALQAGFPLPEPTPGLWGDTLGVWEVGRNLAAAAVFLS